MRLSSVLSLSCTATARHAPCCRPVPLRRCCLTANLSPVSDAQKPWQQRREPCSSRKFASSLPVLRCTGEGGAGGPSSANGRLGGGRGERDRDRPQPAEADQADGGSGPKEPADGNPEHKPSRVQQALGLLTRLLAKKVDTGAALEQNEAAQQQQQQQQQDKEQVTQQAPSARGDGDNTRNALGIPSKQIVKRAPSLMDCVRVREPGSRNKVDSVVLGSADGGARLKVWTLPDGYRQDLHGAKRILIRTAAECVLQQYNTRPVKYQQYDPERKGVPVTRHTAAPAMLVRRGYDVKEEEERAAEAGEVGVLQPSPDMGYTCLVEWASGSQGVYETGWRDLYELVHLEMSWTSGAPVVGQYWTGGAQTHSPNELLWGGRELQKPACLRAHGGAASGGTAYSGTAVRVERGTHWVYGGLDPDMGTIADAADGQQEGMVTVDWPNGISARHHASPVDGYDLCYSARPGDPVTLFTARQGLRVQMADVDDYHGSGVLLKPVAVSADGVVWSVDFPHLYKGFPQKYLMETSTSRRISDAKDYKTVKTELRYT